MYGKGAKFLRRGLDSILLQTYKDIEVVVTDNSDNDSIKNVCEDPIYSGLSISYYRNPIKGMAFNTNEGIKRAKGNLIKILYMDDYFAHPDALKEIAEQCTGYWLVTACAHDNGSGQFIKPHTPSYNKNIETKNTIGSPSVLTIKNENPLLFDETMTWMLDCDYYKRLYEKYGEPIILDTVNVIIGIGGHQTTNHLTKQTKNDEYRYMKKKYGSALLRWFGL